MATTIPNFFMSAKRKIICRQHHQAYHENGANGANGEYAHNTTNAL